MEQIQQEGNIVAYKEGSDIKFHTKSKLLQP